MHIEKLHLQNFRQHTDLDVILHPSVTFIVGEAGSGKTNVLSALSYILSKYFLEDWEGRLNFIRIGPWDKYSPDKPSSVSMQWVWEGERYRFKNSYDSSIKYFGVDPEPPQDSGLNEKGIAIEIASVNWKSLPLLADCGVQGSYGWVGQQKPTSRLDGYKASLRVSGTEQGPLDFLVRSGIVEDLNALLSCLPHILDCRIATVFGHVQFKTVDGWREFGSSSRSTLCVAGMVADLILRARFLNPTDPLIETQGVVLIDMLEGGLDPAWQRRILPDIQAVFPKVQFIVTTNSPFIVQSAEKCNVLNLSRGLMLENPPLGSLEDITENIFGVDIPQRSKRHQDMYDVAKEYFRLLKSSEGANSTELAHIKDKLDQLSAPFSDNIAYHAFLEMERLDAGLGK